MSLLTDVVPFGRSGDVMRLEELSLQFARIVGPAAVALPQVLRASAPHLRTLALFECTLSTGESVLQLLPELVGATQLTCLAILDCRTARPADPLLPLAALGCTQLEELVLCGRSARASALGSLLRGMTSLRRLHVDEARSEFDDAGLRALAACALPLLEELSVSFTDLAGEFSSASNPWRQLQGLRRLDIRNTRLQSQHAFELLGDALGGALTKLTIGGGIEQDALALGALCSRCTALRDLAIEYCRWHVAELEDALARLCCLERVRVDWLAPDAAALARLVARLRPCAIIVCGSSSGPYEISKPRELARYVEAVTAAEAAAEAEAAARRRVATR
jgi:hypothetical protein